MRKVKNEYREKVVAPEIVQAGTVALSAGEEQAGVRSVVGCLRYIIWGLAAVIIAFSGAMAVGVRAGFWAGVFSGLVLFACSLFGVAYFSEKARNLTLLDCALPSVAGLIASVLFTPVALLANGSFFSAVTCFSAALLLSLMLFLYRAKKIGGWWLVAPFLVFIYELLPFEFPGELDNLLSFGGDIINAVIAVVFNRRNLLSNRKTDLLE